MTATVWPKTFPPLTPEQERISDDFMRYWHEVLPRRYGLVEAFNHRYAVRHAPARFPCHVGDRGGVGRAPGLRTALCGAGAELRCPGSAREHGGGVAGQPSDDSNGVRQLPGPAGFPAGSFDRILAIHVLEHLPNLPAAVAEMHRLCHPGGVFSVVIPCEGGWLYGVARRISAQRIFERRYGQSYQWFIGREHINRPAEIEAELGRYFRVVHRHYFPFRVPFLFCNLCVGLTLRPRVGEALAGGRRSCA